MREWTNMNFNTVIESATTNHKALLTVNGDKQEQEKALSALRASLDALNRDVAQAAFQSDRSKRKQWGEIQKGIAELLDEARNVCEVGAADADDSEKIERRYQRMHTRIVKLSAG